MRFNTALALAVAAALSTACGGNASSSADDVLKIGAWVTTTGPIAVSGVPQVQGTQAYFDFANDNGGCGGHQVEWITKDNAYDPQQTLQIARELIQRDQVQAIVSSYGTVTGEPALPFVTEQSEVPMIATAGGAEGWYEPARPNLFGVETLYEDQGAALGGWAVEEGAKTVMVLHSDPEAFSKVADGVVGAAATVDPSVEVEKLSVKFHTTDYSPVVQQVKRANPDAVALILSPEEAAAYLNEAALQGVEAEAYGYAPSASTAVLDLAGDNAEGFHTLSLVKSPQDDSPEVQEYRDAMAEYAPDAAIDFVTMTGFARAKVFCEVVGTIDGDVDSSSISEAFENADTVSTGLLSDMSFSSEQHIGTRQVQRLVVEDGAFSPLGEFYDPPSRG